MLKRSILAAALVLASLPATAQLQTPRPSPKGSVMQTLGFTDVTVTYSRPGVKGRAIWGDVVPFDQVWRTGANEATTITLSGDIMVEGKKLAAGTYSIYTIPGKAEWTVIFNSETKDNTHDATKDVLRIAVKPQAAPMREWMTFDFEDLTPAVPSSGTMALYWEKLRVPVKIETDAAAKVVEKAKSMVDDWSTPNRAAGYLVDTNGNLDEASRWVERSIAIKPTFQNHATKAKLLAAQGKKADALKVAEKAMSMKDAEPKPFEAQVKEIERLSAEWKGKK